MEPKFDNIIEYRLTDFQKQYIILIGNFYNIIKENYIKTDNKKDIIPIKEIYNIFTDTDIFFFSNSKHRKKLGYRNFIEKLKNNLFFKNYFKIKNDTYYLTNLKIK